MLRKQKYFLTRSKPVRVRRFTCEKARQIGMYAVVGCSDCQALKIVEGRPETTQCPRCGKRRTFEKLKKFVETDDEDHAREVRSSMLATRQGEGEAFAELDSFSEMDD